MSTIILVYFIDVFNTSVFKKRTFSQLFVDNNSIHVIFKMRLL